MPVSSQVLKGSETIVAADGTSIVVTLPGSATVDEDRSFITATVQDGDTGTQRQLRQWFTWEFTGGTAAARTQITFTRDTATSAQSVTIHWFVTELASGQGTVQHGSHSPTTTSSAVTLGSSVDITRSVVLISTRHDENQVDQEVFATVDFTNLTGDDAADITFTTGTAPANVTHQYQVIEFAASQVNIYRGDVVLDGAEASDTFVFNSPTGVDLDKSVLVYSSRTGGNIQNIRRAAVEAHFTAVDTVTVQRDDAGTTPTVTVAMTVLEFTDDTEVRSGTETIADTSSTPASQPTFTAVDTGRSIVWNGNEVPHTHQTSTDNGADNRVGMDLVSSTQLDLTRTGTTGALTVPWFVAQWAQAPAGGTILPQMMQYYHGGS